LSKKAGEFRFIAKLVKGTIPWKNCGITLQIIGPADVIYFVPAIANLSHLNPKNLFIILFGLYLLLGIHFPLALFIGLKGIVEEWARGR